MYLFSWGTKSSSRQKLKAVLFKLQLKKKKKRAGLQEDVSMCAYYTLAKQVECPTDPNSRSYGAELALEEDGESCMEI